MSSATHGPNLAGIYWNQGRWNEAEQLEIQVTDMRKKLLGADHPETLSSMANLACTFRNQGKCNESEQLEIQVTDMRKKLLHQQIQQNRESLGKILRAGQPLQGS